MLGEFHHVLSGALGIVVVEPFSCKTPGIQPGNQDRIRQERNGRSGVAEQVAWPEDLVWLGPGAERPLHLWSKVRS